jgi:hypothetical protein
MVIRLVSVSDRTDLLGLHDVFHAILGWTGDCLFDRTQVDWEQQGLPDGPITVGIDGGYVRAAHKEGWFEVIAGKSVVAFRREAEDETPSAKCFGFVQTYDDKPPSAVGVDEIARHEREPAGDFHVRWR